MRFLLSILLVCLLGAGCAQEKPIFGVDGREPKFGDYSKAEIAAVRASIAGISFPVAARTIEKLLPRPVEPLAVVYSDWMPDLEKKGRCGGRILEFWLNHDYVLQVAEAYYAKGDEHFNRDEWAVVLSRKERASFHRPVY